MSGIVPVEFQCAICSGILKHPVLLQCCNACQKTCSQCLVSSSQCQKCSQCLKTIEPILLPQLELEIAKHFGDNNGKKPVKLSGDDIVKREDFPPKPKSLKRKLSDVVTDIKREEEEEDSKAILKNKLNKVDIKREKEDEENPLDLELDEQLLEDKELLRSQLEIPNDDDDESGYHSHGSSGPAEYHIGKVWKYEKKKKKKSGIMVSILSRKKVPFVNDSGKNLSKDDFVFFEENGKEFRVKIKVEKCPRYPGNVLQMVRRHTGLLQYVKVKFMDEDSQEKVRIFETGQKFQKNDVIEVVKVLDENEIVIFTEVEAYRKKSPDKKNDHLVDPVIVIVDFQRLESQFSQFGAIFVEGETLTSMFRPIKAVAANDLRKILNRDCDQVFEHSTKGSFKCVEELVALNDFFLKLDPIKDGKPESKFFLYLRSEDQLDFLLLRLKKHDLLGHFLQTKWRVGSLAKTLEHSEWKNFLTTAKLPFIFWTICEESVPDEVVLSSDICAKIMFQIAERIHEPDGGLESKQFLKRFHKIKSKNFLNLLK